MQLALSQFPDFPAADLPALPEGWSDVSWRNDMCPCYKAADGFGVWIDYADSAMREFPETARFCVFDYNSLERGRRNLPESVEFNTWPDVLAYIASARDGLPTAVCSEFDSIEGAAAWVEEMHKAGKAFHWEDSADSIVSTGTGAAFFTPAQAVLINARRNALYDLTWPEDTCPCGVSLAIEGHYLENGVADFNDPEDRAYYLEELARYRRLFPAIGFKSI